MPKNNQSLLHTGKGSIRRKFENAVYWSLRRKTKKIWYFSDGNSECDFIFQKNEDYSAIQVCYEINGDNQEREINGILAALRFFNLREGVILTIDQTDKILKDGFTISVVPAYKSYSNAFKPFILSELK